MSTSDREELPKDRLELWYLRRKYTIVEAALLIVGHDPSSFEDVEQLTSEERPSGYEAAKTSLMQHMESAWGFGTEIRLPRGSRGGIDIHRSTVSFDQVRAWLAEHGQANGFFGKQAPAPATPTLPDYLNPEHPRYASKLAAAVHAWQAVEAEARSSAKSPKAILTNWLNEHADKFELKSDGKLNQTGIEDVAKVANWKPTGGAPKTPGKP